MVAGDEEQGGGERPPGDNRTMQLDAMSDDVFEEVTDEAEDVGPLDEGAGDEGASASYSTKPPPLPPRSRTMTPLFMAALVGVVIAGIGLALVLSHFVLKGPSTPRAQAAVRSPAPPSAAPSEQGEGAGQTHKLELPAIIIKSGHDADADAP